MRLEHALSSPASASFLRLVALVAGVAYVPELGLLALGVPLLGRVRPVAPRTLSLTVLLSSVLLQRGRLLFSYFFSR